MPAPSATPTDAVLWTFIIATTFPIWLPVVLELIGAALDKMMGAR